jgi:hypothetical protein
MLTVAHRLDRVKLACKFQNCATVAVQGKFGKFCAVAVAGGSVVWFGVAASGPLF